MEKSFFLKKKVKKQRHFICVKKFLFSFFSFPNLLPLSVEPKSQSAPTHCCHCEGVHLVRILVRINIRRRTMNPLICTQPKTKRKRKSIKGIFFSWLFHKITYRKKIEMEPKFVLGFKLKTITSPPL